MNTSDVLNRTADLIEERGWTQGIEGWTSRSGTPLCLEGGIAAAMRSGVEAFGSIPSEEVYACPAYAAVADYLGRNPQPPTAPISGALWDWNDADDRTAAEVIATLRAAAVIEAARENTDAREQVSA